MFRKSSCPVCCFAQGQSVPSDREKTGFETTKNHARHENRNLMPGMTFFLVSTQSSPGRTRFHAWNLACERAHLVCYSRDREYVGGGSRRGKLAGEKNGERKSEPARKPLNFELRPCEVTSLNCRGIKYLTNTSEAKCKQTHSRFSHSRGSCSLWMCWNSAKENYKRSWQFLLRWN